MEDSYERLIEAIRYLPYLYDTGDENYKNKKLKDDAWQQLSEEFGLGKFSPISVLSQIVLTQNLISKWSGVTKSLRSISCSLKFYVTIFPSIIIIIE